MFSITGEENLPVLIGLAVGGALALLVLLVLGSTQLGARHPRITCGAVLRLAVDTLARRAGALSLLWLGLAFAYTSMTVFYALTGSATRFLETGMAAALIFIGHRIMLERPARAVGIDMPDTGFWRILLRSLALGLSLIVTVGAIFVLAALGIALANLAGLTGAAPRLIAGLASGVAAIWLSTLYARLSFVYPSSVLGGRDWFGTALRRAAPVSLGLSVSLWLVAIVSITLIIPLVIGADALMLRLAAELPTTPADLPDDIGTSLFWLGIALEEVPLNLLLVAYSLVSIACVSAAYRLTVLAPGSEADDS